mmetsp:Transcript_65898/g.175508  ORF Transcript_65898/g.175508 Transcript_65898/m.175508 type:complete len:354 (-) Transcript_65898:65-1126(-)
MARSWALLVAGAALAVGRAEVAEDHVIMYKAVAGECVQASVARKFQGAAASLAGLHAGACLTEGFDEAKGSKAIDIPMLGQLKVELFKKADLLDLAVDAGAQALGLQGPSPCCRACPPASTRYYSVDAASGRCTEACVPPGAAYWVLKAVEPSLAQADGGRSCSTLGFPAYNTTVTLGIPGASFSRDVYSPPLKGLVALSKVVAGICGQAIVSEESEAPVAKATGLQRGYCLDRGYAEAAGSKKAEVPVVGAVQMALYRRRGELDIVDALRVSLSLLGAETVTLYKISDGFCGQATIDTRFAGAAKAFAGLTEGTCQEQGYTRPAGVREMTVPVLGEIKIETYEIDGMSQINS